MNKVFTGILLLLSGLVGLAAMLYPLFSATIAESNSAAQPGSLSYALLTTLLISLSVLALWLEIQGQVTNVKIIAALGVLVAITAVLRLVETAIPGIGGFSPVFVPIILAGYVFGARFGFLMGTLSVLTSALITAGIGPWLPYQMLVAGWVGASGGLLPQPRSKSIELGMLVLFSIAWGFLYGAVLNLYFWPFVAGDALTLSAGEGGIAQIATAYGAFYLATSFVWDLFRSAGNAILILVLGVPTIRALTRFRDRFKFEIEGVKTLEV